MNFLICFISSEGTFGVKTLVGCTVQCLLSSKYITLAWFMWVANLVGSVTYQVYFYCFAVEILCALEYFVSLGQKLLSFHWWQQLLINKDRLSSFFTLVTRISANVRKYSN